MTHEEAVKRANEVREGIEKDVDDLAAHFEGVPLAPKDGFDSQN